MKKQMPDTPVNKTTNHQSPNLKTLIRMFLVPTLLIKTGIMYFGLNYSQYPDEGYGYGLAVCITLTILNFGYFLWTFRNYSEDQPSEANKR